jgi:energy-coupling factor transport system ATP-binding protein
MGRNGAGKSTLLRAAAGLLEPKRGRVTAPGGVALLPQRPGDLIVRERVADELPGEGGAEALALMDLEHLRDSDPRDLSGGERERLALAIVAAGRGGGAGQPPAAVLLDEPTRGMDRARKAELAAFAGRLSEAGAAVVIATHDVEFAATFAERVVLMGRGEVVADGPTAELLAGGWYFSTEVARILDGAAIAPEAGAAILREALDVGVAGKGAIE